MPVSLQLAAGAVEYGGGAVALDPTLEISVETGTTTLAGATVQITGGLLAGDELNFTDQNGITGSWDAATGELTLTGTASVADYQAALQSITYSFTGADPTDGGADTSRQFTWAVNDGTSWSNATTSFTTGYDYPQYVAVDAYGNVWVEDDGDNGSYPLSELTDTDGTYAAAPVQVGASLGFPTPVGVGAFVPPGALGFDRQGDLFAIDYDHGGQPTVVELSGVGYSTASTVFTAGYFTTNLLSLAVDPSGDVFVSQGSVEPGTPTLVELSGPNHATVTTISSSSDLAFGLACDSSGDLFAAEPGVGIVEFTAASGYATTVTITAGDFEAPQGLAVDSHGDLFVTDYVLGKLVELTGPNYATAITLASGLNSPTDVALDENGDAFVTETGGILEIPASVTQLGFDYAPVVATAGGPAVYSQGGSAVAVDPSLTLSDPDSSTLAGAVVSIATGLLPGDTLGFTTQNGITGTYVASTGVLTLSGTATVAQYQAALQSITFATTGADPTDGGADAARTISWTVSDASQTSVAATSQVDIEAAPTISGTIPSQLASDAPVDVFAGVTLSDSDTGATETLTITMAGADRTLSGTGLTSQGNGVYTLTGTAAEVTSELQALSFTTAFGAPATYTTTFTLSDQSAAGGASAEYTGTVTETVNPVAISGTQANQATTSEAPVDPFANVSIEDPGGTEALTITLSGAGGTLSGTGLTDAGGGAYTLTGTAAAVTSALEALSFTPTAGGPDTASTTTFTLTDVSSAFGIQAVDSTTSVVDTDPAVAPTITGTVADQATRSTAPVDPFSGVTIGDANPAATDTLTITQVGTSGLLYWPIGLDGGAVSLTKDGYVFTLTGTAAAITSALDQFVFDPTAGAPGSVTTTGFELSDQSSAYGQPTTDTTTSVADTVPALAADDYLASGQSDILIEDGQSQALVVGRLNGQGKLAYTQVGTAASSWTFGGSGDFLNDDRSQYLVETTAGQLMLGEVGASGQAGYVSIGGLGPEWSFEATGDFLAQGSDQFLIENTNGAIDLGSVGTNGQASYVQIGGLGPEWKFLGAGDFYAGIGSDQFLIENTNGAIVLGEVVENTASYTQIGGLGPEWTCVGVGDFLANGSDQFLLFNTNGAVDVGWVGAGDQAVYEQVGALGSEWRFVGVGDYGGTGQSSFLIENTNGTVDTGTVVGGHAVYAQVGGLGPIWSFRS